MKKSCENVQIVSELKFIDQLPWILLLLICFLTLLSIVIRIIVLNLLQIFYPNKYIWKENGSLLFQKYHTLLCTEILLRESLLS